MLGSHWLVDHHPELFDGVSEAISEVGGYSVTVPDGAPASRPRLPAADRREGHRLAAAARPRPGRPRLACPTTTTPSSGWPRRSPGSAPTTGRASTSPSVRAAARRAERRSPASPYADDDPDALLGHLGGAQGFVDGHPAGHRQPHHARGRLQAQRHPADAPRRSLDCRFLPGHEDDADGHDRASWRASTSRSRSCTATSPSRRRSAATWSSDEGGAAGARTPAPRCCRTACPAAPTTRHSSRLGITGYGFAPLRLPADLDFAPMFHGVDERVPVDVAAVRDAGAAAAARRLLSARSAVLRRCAGRG